jgi:hypothetical protein
MRTATNEVDAGQTKQQPGSPRKKLPGGCVRICPDRRLLLVSCGDGPWALLLSFPPLPLSSPPPCHSSGAGGKRRFVTKKPHVAVSFRWSTEGMHAFLLLHALPPLAIVFASHPRPHRWQILLVSTGLLCSCTVPLPPRGNRHLATASRGVSGGPLRSGGERRRAVA